MQASPRCRRRWTSWSQQPSRSRKRVFPTYPIGLPVSATEGASTSWYLLTKAFGGELFDKDFNPLFTSPDSAGYKALAFELMLLKEGLVDPASTGLKDSQINESMFSQGSPAS
jgi:multiple sugar transport system substrate-binding protein